MPTTIVNWAKYPDLYEWILSQVEGNKRAIAQYIRDFLQHAKAGRFVTSVNNHTYAITEEEIDVGEEEEWMTPEEVRAYKMAKLSAKKSKSQGKTTIQMVSMADALAVKQELKRVLAERNKTSNFIDEVKKERDSIRQLLTMKADPNAPPPPPPPK